MYRRFFGQRVTAKSGDDFNEDLEYSSWASLCLTKECSALCVGDRLISSIGGQLIGSGLTTESVIVKISGNSVRRTFNVVVPESRIGHNRAPVNYKKMTVNIYTDDDCIDVIIINREYYRVIK